MPKLLRKKIKNGGKKNAIRNVAQRLRMAQVLHFYFGFVTNIPLFYFGFITKSHCCPIKTF